MGSVRQMNNSKVEDIEDLIHNFLIIVLEHSMRQKDGWKVCYFSPILSVSYFVFIVSQVQTMHFFEEV